MTNDPSFERIAEDEQWIVDVFDVKVDWDEEARSQFEDDPAGYLRRLIKSHYDEHGIDQDVNEIVIGEQLLGKEGPPPNMHIEHVKSPPVHWSRHAVVAAYTGPPDGPPDGAA
jgi:hypothetical protein